MLASVLLMALPISVIGAEFTQQWMEYKKQVTELSGRGFRKLAPRYVELTLKNHTQVADDAAQDEDMQTEIDERMMRIRQIVHQRSKENQALKRKALVETRRGGASQQPPKTEQERTPDGDGGAPGRPRDAAKDGSHRTSPWFPDVIKACLERLHAGAERNDYEMITDIGDLHFAVRWHEFDRRAEVVAARARETGMESKVGGRESTRTPTGHLRGVAAAPLDAARRPRPWGINCSSERSAGREHHPQTRWGFN